jgi:hypothetical protein
VPKEFAGKNVSAMVYDLKGKLVQRTAAKGEAINLRRNFAKSSEVLIVKLKVVD